jgi:hypothetical protein
VWHGLSTPKYIKTEWRWIHVIWNHFLDTHSPLLLRFWMRIQIRGTAYGLVAFEKCKQTQLLCEVNVCSASNFTPSS